MISDRTPRENVRRHLPVWRWAALSLVVVALLGPTRTALSQAKRAGTSSYRVSIEIERVDSLHWEAEVHLANPGPMAAMTLPFHWSGGPHGYRIDSASYKGLRTEYFALKTFLVDSLKQTILIGLIYDLGMGYPPLESGDGPVTRLYFTSRRRGLAALDLDTTFIPPHNTLQLVSPDVRPINPEFHRSGAK